MTPLQILSEFSALEVQISIDGKDLLLMARSDRLSDSLVTTIAAAKPILMEELQELAELAGDDWCEILGSPDQLKVFYEMNQIVKMREKGIVPHHYTATTNCENCGIVPIWEGCGPQVIGCPWCLNRAAGRFVPRLNAEQSPGRE